ncbi:MAG: hypothetical protein IPO08_20905 [Xanthomonadales bacterium]|nr:hypothetical protein [Xanthomonadales bacterium]
MASSLRYRVYLTPLLNSDSNTYGDEIDVTDKIRSTGVGQIRKSIDSSDYDVGVFTFSDLELTAFNLNGYFNENDTRSIFGSGRDRAKVRVEFMEYATVRDPLTGTVLSETETLTVTFRGLINEEATRLDVTAETIRFKVLSRDSVLRTTKVSGGVIGNNDLFSTAMFEILNVPKITSVLTVLQSNINPDLDLEIDDGSYFDDKGVKESLDQLLFASNSCMLIDDAGVVTIRPRTPAEDVDALNLYSKNDIHYRENIIDITAYNTGKQRMFTSFVVNDRETSNSVYVQAYGFRQKKVTLDFMTNVAKIDRIAARCVSEWKTPKIEVNVKVATQLAKGLRLLDPVSVSAPFRLNPPAGKFLPIIGVTKIGDADQPLPHVYGSIEIPGRLKFKVIEIEDSVEKFTSILKLRQAGTSAGDGQFDSPGQCGVIEFSMIGESVLCGEGNPCDNWNPSVIGSAQIGCTMIA